MRLRTVKQICGREFEIVKEGLDESEVETFAAELVGERDILLQRQEHLLSLTRLAERTVAEADKLAGDIKRDVEEEARNKAATILAKAEQEAQEIAEQKRAEILAIANKEAAAIKDSAHEEAELELSQHKQLVQEEIKEMVRKLHNQLVSGLKEVMGQAKELQAEWENKLAEPIIDNRPPDDGELASAPQSVIPEQEEPSDDVELASAPHVVIPEQEEEITPPPTLEADTEYRRNVLEQIQQAWADASAEADSGEQSLTTPSEIAHQPDTGSVNRAAAALDEEEVLATYEGTVELAILPPLAPAQVVEIQKYLRDWPGIGITELRPSHSGYSITVVLDKPMQLIDILRQLPEVEDARDCAADNAEMGADLAPSKDGLRRIAITVCPNT